MEEDRRRRKKDEVEGWRTSVWQLLRDQDAGKNS
jgi:hypothetical protein